MHRLANKHIVFRFKLGALLLIAFWILLIGSLGFLAYAILLDYLKLSWIALGLVTISGLLGLLQWSVSLRARCPLCFMLPLSGNGCSRHRNARRVFGSYRLRVAFSVLFLKRFMCPCCGESTLVAPRTAIQNRTRCSLR